MDCPKCGVTQAAGANECSSCGIIFSRWEQRGERTPPPPPRFTFNDAEPAQSSIPPWVIVAAAMFFIIGGLFWTKSVRKARAEATADADALINDINAKAIQRQKEREASEVASRRAAYDAASAGGRAWPAGLNESDVRRRLESCSYFTTPLGVDIPKSFHSSALTSGSGEGEVLRRAEASGLITFDRPRSGDQFIAQEGESGSMMVNVSLNASAYSQADVSDYGSSWYLGVGPRRLTSLKVAEALDDRAKVTFTWDVARTVGATLDAAGTSGDGWLDFRRNGAEWAVVGSSSGCV